MTNWTAAELQTIGDSEEIDIIAQGPDGTPRRPVTIWVVAVDGGIFVRSAHAQRGAWYQAVVANPLAQVRVGDAVYDILATAEADPATNDRIDAAYHAKYDPFAAEYVPPVVSAESHATTLRLRPR